MAEATTYYESGRGTQPERVREIEREVMLRIIDVSVGVTTSKRWITSSRASGCGPWASATR
jgi:hypothetical protein